MVDELLVICWCTTYQQIWTYGNLYVPIFLFSVMLEASAENISQANFQKAIKDGVKQAQLIIQGIKDLRKLYGKPKRELPPPVQIDRTVEEAMRRYRMCRHLYIVMVCNN